MKKRFLITVCFILALSFTLLVGCGGGESAIDSDQDLSASKYLGTWKATSVEAGEKTGSVDTGHILLTLNGDGTGELNSKYEGEEDKAAVTWGETDGGFVLEGGANAEFTADGDKVKASLFGVDIIFEKVE